jgi:hypothetical protein
MAITVNTTDTFEQWRVKTNQLGSDVDSNIAAVRSDITSNVATITANIASVTGNIVTGNLTIAQNVFGDAIKISGANVIIGRASGNVNTGTNNTFLGFNTGSCNTSGCQNTFLGRRSGFSNNTGANNTFAGNEAGTNNTTGCNNSFFGNGAGGFNTTDSCNTFIGSAAGRNNDGGYNNSFLGAFSGCSNTTGDLNTFMGVFSGVSNNLGSRNTFFGTESGYSNTSGCNNVFLGYRAGCAVTTGVNNTIIGNVAGSAALSNTVIIAAGSNVRAYIDSTGNVGIGTSSPTQLLDVNGNVAITGSARRITGDFSNATIADRLMFQTSTTNGNTAVEAIPNGTATATRLTGYNNSDPTNASYLQIGANGVTEAVIESGRRGTGTFLPMTFYTGGSERVRIDTSGNVGIGTTGATGPLSVKTDTDFVIAMRTTSASTGARVVALNLAENAYKDLVVDGANVQIATGGNERVRITSAGNVGIGTNAPADALQVDKTTAGGTYRTRFILDNQDQRSVIAAYYEGGVGQRTIIQSTAASGVSAVPISFEVGNTEAVRIDSSGNMGIGTSSPTVKLDVNGNLRFGSPTTTNIFLGYNSGASFGSGTNNTFLGNYSGNNTTTGNKNVFLGRDAGVLNTTGCYNTFLGTQAGYSNNTGNGSTIIGDDAGVFSTGSSNVFAGRCAGAFGSGAFNTFVGNFAGLGVIGTSGCNNTYLGYAAGRYNSSGSFNFFGGTCAGYSNTSGRFNTFVGIEAGRRNISGCLNTFLGLNAGDSNTSGCDSVAVGASAGFDVTTGCNNIFLGYLSGTLSNLGYTTTQSNRIIMGNCCHTLACIQIAWSVASDVRDKCIYGPVPFGKTFLRQINPITYSFKNRETNEIRDDRKRFGFCAQEILALQGSEDIIVNTDDPNKLGMAHEYLIPVLVNAVKELADELDELRAEIQQLKSA